MPLSVVPKAVPTLLPVGTVVALLMSSGASPPREARVEVGAACMGA